MNPYLILVNKSHPVPQDYLSHIELEWTCGANDQKFLIERQTLAAYEALAAYIKKTENIIIGAGNSYRSFEMQQQIYEKLRTLYGKDYADAIVAPVGTSEHHLGICIDLQIYFEQEGFITNNNNMERICPIFEKHIHPHLSKFGFILRYPRGKETVTGYPYEPWHIRYTGCNAALSITQDGLTLEEWIQKHQAGGFL
jgi:D-alanyl-D-alanine carboxypeptidase